MVLKRVQNMLNSRFPGSSAEDIPDQDSPEANATRGVAEEIQYLPDIVTAAESSPAAAQACAYQIRKFLAKAYNSKPHIQYNAIMLIRILADNPGPTFTRNIDSKFIDTVKEALRTSKDQSVQQILRETLHSLERDKAYDVHLNPLFAMWRKEQYPPGMAPRTLNAPGWNPQMAGGFPPPQPSRSPQPQQPQSLPPPSELSARVEEARTSAKLLLQLIQSTPAAEVDSNDLIKEFGERCQQAQRSMQIYINMATASPPSGSNADETLLTLIETNEQLSLALTKHQRAMLSARRSHSSTKVNRDSQEQQNYTGPTTASGSVYSQSGSVSPSATYSSSPYTPIGAPPPPHLQSSLANRYTSPDDQRQQQQQPYQAPGALPPVATSGRSTPLMDPTKTAYGPDPSEAHDHDDPFADSHSAQYGGGAQHPSSTHAYFARQESAGNHATMHGGAQAFSPVDERGGAGMGTAGDVSPVEETRRGAGEARYRY
ncbi:hypothetical protein IWZ00DRAFT_65948 [Phyllosticta capitalensis]